MTKLPFRCDGSPAKSNDPTTWTTFEEVFEKYTWGRNYTGIGFVFTEGGGICGVDLDGCRNPETGEWSSWAREIINDFQTYTEMSPSGTGAKMFVLGNCPLPTGKNRKVEGVEKCSDKDPGIEVYDKLRYFAITGDRLSGLPEELQPRQDILDWYCCKWFPVVQAPVIEPHVDSERDVMERARKYLSKIPAAVSGSGGHNVTFNAACVLVLGFGLSSGDALQVLAEWNSGCQPPWSEKELIHKIEDAGKQSGPRNFLRNVPEQRWHTISVQNYQAPPEPPKSTTLKESAEAYLQSVKGGTHKLISLGVADADYAIGGGIELGEMVVIAARPGHGKTCVGLQAAYSAAAEGHSVLIISEEMSKMALGKRALQFASNVPQESWAHRDTQVLKDLEEHFLMKAPIYVVESCGTAERAKLAIERHVEQYGVSVVVVDYGQLLQSRGATRYEQVTQTSITLRQVANQNNVSMIVLAQLNRAVENREKFIPKMGDLRDSGQIEQDADVILFLLWPHRLDSSHDPHEFFVFVGKNRSRPINEHTVKCKFSPSRQMIEMERAVVDVDMAVDGWDEQYTTHH